MKHAKPIIRMGPRLREADSKKGSLSLSDDISVSKKHSISMGSEYLTLTDTASKLGTYQLNRDAPPLPRVPYSVEKSVNFGEVNNIDVENVREEAELLWKFAKSAPSINDIEDERINENHSPLSPSLSFEAKRHFCAKKKCSDSGPSVGDGSEQRKPEGQSQRTHNNRFKQDQRYTLAIPCLSLDYISKPTQSVSSESLSYTPARLFSRPITTRNSDVKLAAETLASNIMQSFLKALDWRSKVWLKSLSDFLDMEYKLKSENNSEVQKIIGNKADGSEEECHVNNDSVANKTKMILGKTSSQSIDLLRHRILQSKEAKVLQAIGQVAASVVVHDVRTTFHVLEQQLDRNQNANWNEATKTRDSASRRSCHLPPYKKRKISKCHEDLYKLSHAINLETRCTVSTKCKNSEEGHSHMSIVMQAPGIITGTFVRNNDAEIKLVDVVVELDTLALALSMEKNSRLVIRTAAQKFILNPPKSEFTRSTSLYSHGMIPEDSSESEPEPEYEEEEEEPCLQGIPNHTSIPTTPYSTDSYTRYPEAVMVTPLEQGFSSSSESEDMPPPPPRLPLEEDRITQGTKNGYFLHPRRVSPPMISSPSIDGEHNHNVSPDPFASPTPMKSGSIPSNFDVVGKGKSHNLVPPFLVSPRTPSDEGETKGGLFSLRLGPSLPALVEVACAAHARCN